VYNGVQKLYSNLMDATETFTNAPYATTAAFRLTRTEHWFVVTVDWEWSTTRYVMPFNRSDPIAIDFAEVIRTWHRDEGFVIMDVKPL
jgi:hypothetical protein